MRRPHQEGPAERGHSAAQVDGDFPKGLALADALQGAVNRIPRQELGVGCNRAPLCLCNRGVDAPLCCPAFEFGKVGGEEFEGAAVGSVFSS